MVSTNLVTGDHFVLGLLFESESGRARTTDLRDLPHSGRVHSVRAWPRPSVPRAEGLNRLAMEVVLCARWCPPCSPEVFLAC